MAGVIHYDLIKTVLKYIFLLIYGKNFTISGGSYKVWYPKDEFCSFSNFCRFICRFIASSINRTYHREDIEIIDEYRNRVGPFMTNCLEVYEKSRQR